MIPLKLSSLLLLSTTPVVLAQKTVFYGDGPQIALIAVWSINLFSFLVLATMAFVGIIVLRRKTFVSLLATLLFLVLFAAASLAITVLSNLFPLDVPTHLNSALNGFQRFFSYWGYLLIFVTVVVAMHDRLATMDGKQLPEEDVKTRRIFMAVHGFFVLLLFVLGTASAGMITDVLRKAETGGFDVDDLRRRLRIGDDLRYAFSSFQIFTAFDVVALAIYLRKRLQASNVKDQVSNTLVYVVTPLYVLFALIIMVFLIVLSPVGVPQISSNYEYERARVFYSVFLGLSIISMLGTIALLGFSRMKWETRREESTPANVTHTVAPMRQTLDPQQAYYAQQPIYSPPQWPLPTQDNAPLVRTQ